MLSKLIVNATVGNHISATALKTGAVSSDHVGFNFVEMHKAHDAFKRVITGEFDCAEFGIMNFMQARGYDKGLVALPVVLDARYRHGQIVYNSDKGVLSPKDLEGRRVGSGTYPQTTPIWVRAILEQDYGVDLSKINWTTFGAGDLPEYQDPPNARRAPAGKKLLPMLMAGELDAAIVSDADRDQHPNLKTVIPDPAAAAKEWYRKYQAPHVNHIIVVKESFVKKDPQAVREIYRLFVESRNAANLQPGADGMDQHPIGYANVRRAFEVAAQCSWRQRMIPRELKVGDLFDDVTGALER